MFGDTSALPHGVVDLFTRTGTRHMLALSGLHVGLVGVLIARPLARAIAAVLGVLARALGARSRPDPGVLLALLAVLFIPLAGYGAPATRAALALAFAAVGPALPGLRDAGRRPFGLNLLGVALAFEMAVDPRAVIRPGVQLSYLATSALIAAGPGAHRWAKACLPGGGSIARVGRTGRARPVSACVAAERLVAGLAGGIAASVVASLATLPVVWTNFGEWSPVGILATPLVFAPMVVLVGGGWLWLACPIEGAGDELLAWAARTMLEMLHAADHVPWSPMPLPERPLLLLGAAAAAGLVACRHGCPHAGRRAARWSACLFAVALFPWSFRDERATTLEIHVAEVGDGTAIVVRAPGEPTVLFDAGSRNRVGVGQRAIAPLLRHLDVGRLVVALSHDHEDHARALPWLARRWPPEVWIGPIPRTSERGRLGPRPAAGARHVTVERGALSIECGDGTLHVTAVRGEAARGNEGSLTVNVRWRGARVVLSGDAEGHGLASMLDNFDGAPPSVGGRWMHCFSPTTGRAHGTSAGSSTTCDRAKFGSVRPRCLRERRASAPGGAFPWLRRRAMGPSYGPRHSINEIVTRPLPWGSPLCAFPSWARPNPRSHAASRCADLLVRGRRRSSVGLEPEPCRRPRGDPRVGPEANGAGRPSRTSRDTSAPVQGQARARIRQAGQERGHPAGGASRLGPGQRTVERGLQARRSIDREAPARSGLRDVCASLAPNIAGMPERGSEGELEALLELGKRASMPLGGGSPATREALVERFSMAASRDELLAAVRECLKSKSTPERSFAMFLKGRLFPTDDPRGLLLSSVYDPSPDGRKIAARAVGDIGASEIGLPLVKAMYSKSPKIRQRAAEAIGFAADKAFVEPLMDRLLMLAAPRAGDGGGRAPHSYLFIGTQRAYVQDFDVEVAQGVSVADPIINTLTTGVVLDVGIVGIQDVTILQERRIIRRALERVVGDKPGNRTKDWQRWWESEAAAPFRDRD